MMTIPLPFAPAMPIPTLRPYQLSALDAIQEARENGRDAALIVLATGCGKTIVFSELIRRWDVPTLVLAHREELLTQARDKLRTVWPHADIGLIGAGYDERSHHITIASVASLVQAKRLAQFAAPKLGLVVVDEAHHTQAPTYKRVLKGIGVGQPNGPFLLGVTATPQRSDGKSLAPIYGQPVFTAGLADMVRANYLCDLRGVQIKTGTRLDEVAMGKDGDFNEDQLAAAVNQPDRNRIIVDAFTRHSADRPTIVFAVDVAHAHDLAELFRARGITAAALDGTTPRDERHRMLHDFTAGRIQVLCNMMVLCLDEQTEILTREGWRGIDAILPTDHIANFNLDGSIFFDIPKQIIKRNRQQGEAMVSLKTSRAEFRVTSGHQMLHRFANGTKWMKRDASELVGKSGIIPVAGRAMPDLIMPQQEVGLDEKGMKRAVSANAYELRSSHDYEWEASFQEATKRLEDRHALKYTAPADLTLDECRFIGFWLGDGTSTKLSSGGVEHTFTQSLRYSQIVTWIDALVERLGYDCVRKERQTTFSGLTKRDENGQADHNHIRWSFSRGTGFGPQRRKGLYSIEPYLNKDGVDLLWGLSAQQFDAILHGLWLADGAHGQSDEPIGGYSYRGIVTVRSALRDLLQAIGTCRGFRSSYFTVRSQNDAFLPQYVMSFRKTDVHTMPTTSSAGQPKLESDWQSERVWCVTSTSGNIVTRRNGNVTIMGNCEGYDEPSVSCLILARPTQSRSLYVQMAGRGSRLAPGKKDCLIIDVADNTMRHSLTLMSLPKLAGREGYASPVENLGPTGTGNGGAPKAFSVREALDSELTSTPIVERNIALLADAFTWERQGSGNYRLRIASSEPRGGKATLLLALRDEGYLAQVQWDDGDIQTLNPKPLTLDWAQTVAEDAALNIVRGNLNLVDRRAPWRGTPASDKQLGMLKRLGVLVPRGRKISKGDASDMISAAMAQQGKGKSA